MGRRFHTLVIDADVDRLPKEIPTTSCGNSPPDMRLVGKAALDSNLPVAFWCKAERASPDEPVPAGLILQRTYYEIFENGCQRSPMDSSVEDRNSGKSVREHVVCTRASASANQARAPMSRRARSDAPAGREKELTMPSRAVGRCHPAASSRDEFRRRDDPRRRTKSPSVGDWSS